MADLRLGIASLFSDTMLRCVVPGWIDDAIDCATLTLRRSHRLAQALPFPRRSSPGVALLTEPTIWGATTRPSNKGMQLTKLSAAPLHESKCRLMPAPSHSYAGTASQLIPGVRPTVAGAARGSSPGRTRRESSS
jgi:hypothetical protein